MIRIELPNNEKYGPSTIVIQIQVYMPLKAIGLPEDELSPGLIWPESYSQFFYLSIIKEIATLPELKIDKGGDTIEWPGYVHVHGLYICPCQTLS
jgi:hypothetical protein